MMADLVGDHVGLCELAAFASDVAAAEALLDILKERGVEIDLLIIRTIEWTHGGRGKPACRLRGAGVHDERRWLVGFPGACEDLLPLDFRAPEHSGHELPHLIGLRVCLGTPGGGLRLLLRAAQAGQHLRSPDQVKRIDAQSPADETEKDDGAKTDAAGATHGRAAPILDVVAARKLIETHGSFLRISSRRSASLHDEEAV